MTPPAVPPPDATPAEAAQPSQATPAQAAPADAVPAHAAPAEATPAQAAPAQTAPAQTAPAEAAPAQAAPARATLLEIVSGAATAEEIAALTAVLAAIAADCGHAVPACAPAAVSGWAERPRLLRSPLAHAPAGWRASARPR
jgi:hypothetical protein